MFACMIAWKTVVWTLGIVLAMVLVLMWMFTDLIALLGEWVFGLERAIVHGSVDPNNRIVVFNHPTTFLEYVSLYWVFHAHNRIIGLARDTWLGRILLRNTRCVFVPRQGGANTTQRIQENLRSHSMKFGISAYTLDPGCYDYGGVLRGVGMPPKIKSIACRITGSVQPAVVIYKGLDVVPKDAASILGSFSFGLQRRRITPHVFLLPTMHQKDYPTTEAFVEAVRTAMDTVLRRESMHICSV